MKNNKHRLIIFLCLIAGLGGCVQNIDVSQTRGSAMTYVVRGVGTEIERQPDGKKYPNYVKESYELSSDSGLKYSAYFGGMPLDMNHNDDVLWNAGAHGRKVREVLTAIVSDPVLFADLKQIPDEGGSPCSYGDYSIYLTQEQMDVNYCAKQGSNAFVRIDEIFSELIAAFELSNGRPLTPHTLPQEPNLPGT